MQELQKIYLFALCSFFFALINSGCINSIDLPISELIPSVVVDEAEGLNNALISHDLDLLLKNIHPMLESELSVESFEDFFSSTKGTEILGSNLVGYAKEFGLKVPDTHYLRYELQTSDGFVDVTYGLMEAKYCCLLNSISTEYSEISFTKIHDFTLREKGIVHWVFFVISIFIPAFIVFSLFHLAKIPNLAAKPLWAFFILFGIHGVLFDWTHGNIGWTFLPIESANGDVTVNFVKTAFLGFEWERGGPLTPWILTAYFPVGAIIFWFKYFSMRQ